MPDKPEQTEQPMDQNSGESREPRSKLDALNDKVSKVLGPADIESAGKGPHPDSRSEEEFSEAHGVEVRREGGQTYAVPREGKDADGRDESDEDVED
ncbi:hypothetical protein [Sediminivirga luteola]|uniref:hypothetical protein n=1 Tax=Sediminivirga luteola TaxID=1774748 RepID=UPI001F57CF25|nr:hypothetical protein [Sediminivirga luteola]MCI2265211.1 hypothetical protein [Sediminivirga luteola]